MLRPLALALLALSVAGALPAEARGRVPASPKARPAAEVKAERIRAYEQARAELAELGEDPKRRQFRHHWLGLAKRLDAMGERKDHPRRCEALFTGARLYAELAEVSYLADDRRAAADRYRRVGRACPTSNLADDALFRAAELLAPADPAAARFEVERLLEKHGDGDQVRKARELLARLKAEDRRRPEPRPALAPTKPEVAKPEVVKAEVVKPEVVKPEVGKPEVVKPEVAKPEVAKPEVAKPEVAKISAPIAPEAPAATAKPAPRAAEAAPAADAPENAELIAEILASPVVPAPAPAGNARDAAAPVTAPRAEPAAPRATDPALDGSRLDRLAALERATGDLTLSTLAGLKVRRVVIDPGHGGRDAGAIGKGGTRESKITLAIAKKLRRRLEGMGLEVLLTRDADTTVSLESRTAFANERRADLFLSIHCNAAKSRKLRGVETYTLNLNSDRYAMRLAARENAGSERAVGDLQFILADLATKANTDDSVRLAGSIHTETVSRLSRRWDGVKDLGTKQALFFVLLGAKMPAVLFETSFLSHPEEEQRLASDGYQDELAAGIAEGVRRFISDREAVARGPTIE